MERIIYKTVIVSAMIFAAVTKSCAMPATAGMMGAGAVGASSALIQVETLPEFSQHWHTIFTNEVPLHLDWSDGATHAELEITGMNGSLTTNLTAITSHFLWRVFSSSSPSAEDVYNLTATFYNSNGVAVNTLTSQLALVTAAFGSTTVITDPAIKAWTSLRNNVVIPYDAEWTETAAGAESTQLVIANADGMTKTNALSDAAGFYGWKIKDSDWGYGIFNLALTFPGTLADAWDATLVRVPEGMIILLR